ncbi:hypothetical protein Tco_0387451 [Tanacetum coccineum]
MGLPPTKRLFWVTKLDPFPGIHYVTLGKVWRSGIIIFGLSRIFEASRARGFVLRSLELQILSFIWEIQYPNLID